MAIFGFITEDDKTKWLRERAGKAIDNAISEITKPVEQVKAAVPKLELPKIPQITPPSLELPKLELPNLGDIGRYTGADFVNQNSLQPPEPDFQKNAQNVLGRVGQASDWYQREIADPFIETATLGMKVQTGGLSTPRELQNVAALGQDIVSGKDPRETLRQSRALRSGLEQTTTGFAFDPINLATAGMGGKARVGIDLAVGASSGISAGEQFNEMLGGGEDTKFAAQVGGLGLGAGLNFLPEGAMAGIRNVAGRRRPKNIPPPPTKVAQQAAAQAAAQATVPTNQFVKELRPFDDVLGEVKTAGNPVARAVAKYTGINPSAAETSDSGRIGIAAIRQRNAGAQQADLAIQQSLDEFEPRLVSGQATRSVLLDPAAGVEGTVFNLWDGKIQNVTPKTPGASLNWHDVFSRPGDYNLNPEQQKYVARYLRLAMEAEDLRVASGLTPRAVDLGPDNFYVPRRAVQTGDVPLDAPSNPSLMRQYDLAQEGVDAGVEYLNDPREVMRLHLRATYQEIADHQLNQKLREAVQGVDPATGKARMVAPKNLVAAPLVQERRDAVLGLRQAKEEIRRERNMAISSIRQVDADITQSRQRLTAAEKELARIRGELSGRAQTATGQRQTPLSYGPRLQAAQQAVDAAKSELRQLQRLKADIPRYSRQTGNVGTSARSQQAFQDATSRYNRARTSYSQGLKTARNASAVDASLFGGTTGEKIPVKLWKNNFIREEDYDAIARTVGIRGETPNKPNVAIRAVEKIASTSRYFSAVGDMAMPLNQGLTLLGRNPVAWSRMAARHYYSFFDPTVQSRYLSRADNMAAAQEMVKHGVELGNTNDLLTQGGVGLPKAVRKIGPVREFAKTEAGKAIGEVASRTRKQLTGRFETSYGTGLTMARMELWKALSPHYSDKAELASYINKMTGGLNSQNLGASAGQRAAESMWMAFSPRLLRSTTALVADALNPTKLNSRSAWDARTTLAGMTAAGMLMYVTAGKILQASGHDIDDQDIRDGLNPLNRKQFLSYKIGNDWYGIGGQVRSLMQLGTRVGAAGVRAAQLESAGDTEGAKAELAKLVSSDSNDNPFLSFAMTRGAPGVTMLTNTTEAATGVDANPYKEVEGLPGLAKATAEGYVPFTAQNKTEGQSDPAVAASFLGARTSPATPTDKLDTIAQEQYSTPDRRVRSYYDDLQRSEQDAVRRGNPELTKQAIEKSSPQRKEYESEKAFYEERQASYDRRLLEDGDYEKWRDRFATNRDQLKAVRENIYGRDKENTEKDPILKAYYDIVKRYETDGEVDWDKVDREVIEQGLDQEHIDRETGLGWTDAIRAYRAKQKEAKPYMDLYMDEPRFRGLSVEEGEIVQDLIDDAKSYATIHGIRSQRTAVSRLAKERGLTGKIVSAAKRPNARRNKKRAKIWKKYPILEQTYGSLAPDEVLEAAREEA